MASGIVIIILGTIAVATFATSLIALNNTTNGGGSTGSLSSTGPTGPPSTVEGPIGPTGTVGSRGPTGPGGSSSVFPVATNVFRGFQAGTPANNLNVAFSLPRGPTSAITLFFAVTSLSGPTNIIFPQPDVLSAGDTVVYENKPALVSRKSLYHPVSGGLAPILTSNNTDILTIHPVLNDDSSDTSGIVYVSQATGTPVGGTGSITITFSTAYDLGSKPRGILVSPLQGPDIISNLWVQVPWTEIQYTVNYIVPSPILADDTAFFSYMAI